MNSFEISWSTLWRIFFMLLLVAGLFLIRDILAILFLAIVISSALNSPVDFLERKKIPRILSTFVIFIVFFAILALLLYTIIPISIIELKSLLENLNKLDIPVFGSLDTSPLIEKLNTNLGNITDLLLSGGVSFLGLITTIFGNIILIFATIMVSFYLTINRDGVEKFLRAILPIGIENYAVEIYLRTRRKLGLWLQGQLILMFAVGLVSFLGLWILGVKYSLILGILAGLLEIVPIAGPIFTGTVVFIVTAPTSWTLALYTVILFIIIHESEGHILVPLVMKSTIGISPVVVLLSLLAGSQIAGIIGIILAVPTAVIFQEIIEDWEKRKLRSPKRLI